MVSLTIEPSDDPFATVRVDYIRVLSRLGAYMRDRYGSVTEKVKGQFRDSIYMVPPASLSFPITIPNESQFLFGLGQLGSGTSAVTIRFSANGKEPLEIFKGWIKAADGWRDYRLSLTDAEGKSGKLEIKVDGGDSPAVVLWSTPRFVRSELEGHAVNVLIYLIDALSSKHIGVTTGRADLTPHIDTIAHQGTFFPSCVAPCNWTRASVSSILTSLGPSFHGNVDYSLRLTDDVITLFEAMHRSGYRTAIFTSNYHAGTSSNLHKGVDVLYDVAPHYRGFNASSEHLNKLLFP